MIAKPKKIAKVKNKKPVSLTKLKLKADNVFSKFIRRRDNHVCITCGKDMEENKSQCGHYIPRGCLPLRYSEKNCHAQCFACNVLMKGNYTIYAIRMMEKYGDNILYELDEIVKESKKNIGKYGREFYENIIKIYG